MTKGEIRDMIEQLMDETELKAKASLAQKKSDDSSKYSSFLDTPWGKVCFLLTQAAVKVLALPDNT